MTVAKDDTFVCDPDKDRMLEEAAFMLNSLIDKNIPDTERWGSIRDNILAKVPKERAAKISAFLESGEASEYMLQRSNHELSAVACVFEFSREILKKHNDCFVHVTPHDQDDHESPDKLWLEYTPDDEMCSGKYLSVQLLDAESDLWSISINDANKFGGICETWGASGRRDEVLSLLGRDFDCF